MASTVSNQTVYIQIQKEKNYLPELTILTSLFSMWGFLTCLNDILIPHLQNVFELNYFQSMLV